MRWLHLTDLHVGLSDNTAQAVALKSLTGFIKESIEGKTLDLVILTGDLRFVCKPSASERRCRGATQARICRVS